MYTAMSDRPSTAARGRRPREAAFTLVELMVVIGILAVLLAVLLPTVAAARRSGRQTQCAANLRQVATALVGYASANGGAYPPNSAEIKTYWYQRAVIGSHVSAPTQLPDDSLAGGALVCPDDADEAIRSYSMNLYGSGYVSKGVRARLESNPRRGDDCSNLARPSRPG